ncbi:MAG: hypothetical protein ACK47B_19950 [Armatimonadota bacterium]
MRSTFRLLALAAGLAAAPAAAVPLGVDRVLLTETEALMVGPVEAVSSAMVRQAEWSPTGRYVLVARESVRLGREISPDKLPEMESSVSFWNRDTGKSRTVWSTRGPAGGLRAAWMPRTEVAVFLADEPLPPPPAGAVPPAAQPGAPPPPFRRVLYIASADRGTARPLILVPPTSQLAVSPVAPAAVVWDSEPQLIRVVQPTGTIRAVGLPPGFILGFVHWAQDGRALVRGHVMEGDKLLTRQLLLDVTSGRLEPTEREVAPYQKPEEQGPLSLVVADSVVRKEESARPIRSLWLQSAFKSDASRVMVAADSERSALSPREDAVLYTTDAAVYVVPLVRMSKESYLAAREAAQRAVAMSNGKQLGVALMMYAQDYDETLPDGGADVAGLLAPYVKNDALFAGFTYTFGGGKLSDIEKPGETVLGYVVGPNGRAQIFADGHVTWLKDEGVR